MRLLPQDDTKAAQWLIERAGGEFHAPFTTMAFGNDTGIKAVFLFNRWNGFNVELSCAIDGKMVTRGMMNIVKNYVWQQLKATRVTVTARADNNVNKIYPRLGFSHEGVLRAFYGDCDAHVWGLIKGENNV